MPNPLGKRIKNQREELEIGLRELAQRINKSPSFLSILENDDSPPSISEKTLHSLARVLKLNPDDLIPLAGKTPEEVAPSSGLEVALYRHVKHLSRKEKEKLLRELQSKQR